MSGYRTPDRTCPNTGAGCYSKTCENGCRLTIKCQLCDATQEETCRTGRCPDWPNAFRTMDTKKSAFEEQYGGSHYKLLAIQPVEYITRNKLGFCEGNAIKYITRWRVKGGVEDLYKAKHYIEMLIETAKDDKQQS